MATHTRSELNNIINALISKTDLQDVITANEHREANKQILDYIDQQDILKQNILESGVNIKTVNGQSLIGSGNVAIDFTSYFRSLPSFNDIDSAYQALGANQPFLLEPDFILAVSKQPTVLAPLKVNIVGNSIVNGDGGGQFVSRTAGFLGLTYGTDVLKNGVSGSTINGMKARFDAEVIENYDPEKFNVYVGLEGTNSAGGRGTTWPTEQDYVDDVKDMLQDVKDAGYDAVVWMYTTSQSDFTGITANNDWFKTTNDLLKVQVPAMGDGFYFLDQSNAPNGKFGNVNTAPNGLQPSFSSYSRRYAGDGTHDYRIGAEIRARNTADIINYIYSGTAMPDRSTYLAPLTTSGTAVTWTNANNTVMKGTYVEGTSSINEGNRAYAKANEITNDGQGFQFRFESGNCYVGLHGNGDDPNPVNHTQTVYSLNFTTDENIKFFQAGNGFGVIGTYTQGDKFEIRLTSAGCDIYQNDSKIYSYTSYRTPMPVFPIAYSSSVGPFVSEAKVQ